MSPTPHLQEIPSMHPPAPTTPSRRHGPRRALAPLALVAALARFDAASRVIVSERSRSVIPV